MFSIKPLNNHNSAAIQQVIDSKTKPLGALGQLEYLAKQLMLIQSQQRDLATTKLTISAPSMLVFAADHCMAQQGISIAPSEVTRQMVLNFLQGGAAINCFCRSNNIAMKVIDAGINTSLTSEEKSLSGQFIEQRLGAGINDISKTSAMSDSQVQQGLLYGKKVTTDTINQGCNILLLGEMGIGNTSSASAILAAYSQQPVEQCVGNGTGINAQQLSVKKQLIAQAISRLAPEQVLSDPYYVLKELAGFEIVQMVGAILTAAEQGIAVLIDGFIVTSAALVATKINPIVRDYLIFAHQSNEYAHQLMLTILEAKPLLNLGLRLGEGTGAALALPLLKAAASFYNDMASFESAGVTV
ncbi:nicotinate-nucleotide--dimethylbenzimidazole phosphoribosyltransferase [Colwellia sp. 1_MG-2023]|uniref:nicotinate-nucleotide--dimethylbenzimidazole phosphoribosyltransferase n=1 Tax=Colwellia sp. 1_MG-2023 TaxID=3062649 RepID=UPI0026E26247|nr:nicotinate-nucleotide--dimethylbenzimidazole phosphoribosyltransferase [Colwellia sp. 1_MG-2023]MDO6447200.1 nicotinate-nucleotide--dimethylbenzimidazole phosphoribosyltransferase [Colwellia sp. 1_MG-2023]